MSKKTNAKEARLKESEKRIRTTMNSIIFPSDIDLSNKGKDPYIALQNINKIYDNDVQAVFDFNLDVSKNEFIVLVGPSGCGKSTTLRMICGLESITRGHLFINRKYSNELPPKDRDIAMVFQSYALYPHMTVFDNMAFSLKIRKVNVPVLDENGNQVMWIDNSRIKELQKRMKELRQIKKECNSDIKKFEKEIAALKEEEKNSTDPELKIKIANKLFVLGEKIQHQEGRIVRADKELLEREEKLKTAQTTLVPKTVRKHYSKEEIRQKVEEVAKILDITDYLNRKPKALSGGQRQRVALGRAIVRNAAAFLMDEPLSNLDAKLRVQMRSEIVRLHRKVGATTIYVTHDQTEAMTMADRIVIMNEGVVQQIGSPRDIYEHPNNFFVATFIGSPAMNTISGTYDNGVITPKNNEKIDLGDSVAKKVKDYYKSEIERLTQTSGALDLALKDEEDPRHDIYEYTKAEITKILNLYKENVKGKFDFILGIRPEDITVSTKTDKEAFEFKAEVVELLGSEYYVHTTIGGEPIVFKLPGSTVLNTNDTIYIKFNKEKIHIFDAYTKRTII